MKLMVACCCVGAAFILSGCSSTGRATLPMSVGNGAGSEHGNYAAHMDGETEGPSGERCILFNWDRPLGKDFALRLRSASCESTTAPGRMVGMEISRTIIPLSDSNVTEDQEAANR